MGVALKWVDVQDYTYTSRVDVHLGRRSSAKHVFVA
jgi:hypothetical protein